MTFAGLDLTLDDLAAWATIAAVPLAVVGIAATLVTAGGTQRDRRKDLRELLQRIKAECDKARSAINDGQDIPLVWPDGDGGVVSSPDQIIEASENVTQFAGDIRFISDTDIRQLASSLETVYKAWYLVKGQIFDDMLDTKYREKHGPGPAALRRRIRSENLLLQTMDRSDPLIDKMLARLRKLDRHNIVGAWKV